jgi:hypothetical protein
MREIDENLKALIDDRVALVATQARDEAHATCVMLVARIIEALGRGKPRSMLVLGIQFRDLLRSAAETLAQKRKPASVGGGF